MSDNGAGGGPGEELLFRAKVTEIIDEELKKKLKGMRLLIGAFVAGFAVFIGAGLTWKDNLLRPVVESVYPASYITGKVKAELLSDESFNDGLITDEHKGAIADQIARSISEHIDSGYTKTIIFSDEVPPDQNFLIFYARKGQEVELTLLANAIAGPDARFRMTLDNQSWGEPRSFPFNIVQGNITEHLRFDAAPGANLHMIRFTAEGFQDGDRAIINCVVLVRNPSS